MTIAASLPSEAAGRSPDRSPHRAVLRTAVERIGGSDRSGQIEMADAVSDALQQRRHLLVQAGTGTGKSLGYLAPALTRLTEHGGERIVVATATLALQRQLATADIPAALHAVEQVTGRRPTSAILKGRTNYVCRLRVSDDAPEEQGSLLSPDDLAALPSGTPNSALSAE